MPEKTVREVALDSLLRMEKDGAYSHLVIDNELNKGKIPKQDEGLLTEIVYGTIQYKFTLDYYLKPFVKSPKKITPWAWMLLRMSVYQMVYLSRVPDHAIIHEAVEITKQRGHKGIVSFVNAVLRNVQRKGILDTSKIDNEAERIAIETSHPQWLVERWIAMYGQTTTQAMCAANITRKPLSVRVQPLKLSREETMEQMSNEGFDVRPSIFSKQGIIIEKGNVLKTDLFRNGILTVQDQSSMLVGEMLDVRPGMDVLDACSAPGGKATHVAEKMANCGRLFAYDLNRKKAKLVQQKAEHLGLTVIVTSQEDARKLQMKHEKESFDRILIDAPCSGLGVIRGKPEIKYNKTVDDIEHLAGIQQDILQSVSPLLKKGGYLIYSTCTVDKTENENVVKSFLRAKSDFNVDADFFHELPDHLLGTLGESPLGVQLFPQTWQTDGFFLTRLQKDC